MKKGLIHGSLTLLVLAILALPAAPSFFENSMNVEMQDTQWPVSAEARALHDTLRIADLHSDTLRWKRDMLDESTIGHVDLPRLQRGGVNLQVFSAVTKSRRGRNYSSNSADTGDITPAAVARPIAYAVELVGAEHVALGSDYDGSTTVSFDTADLAVLTQALLDAGDDESTIRRVKGENQLRFLAAQLP